MKSEKQVLQQLLKATPKDSKKYRQLKCKYNNLEYIKEPIKQYHNHDKEMYSKLTNKLKQLNHVMNTHHRDTKAFMNADQEELDLTMSQIPPKKWGIFKRYYNKSKQTPNEDMAKAVIDYNKDNLVNMNK